MVRGGCSRSMHIVSMGTGTSYQPTSAIMWRGHSKPWWRATDEQAAFGDVQSFGGAFTHLADSRCRLLSAPNGVMLPGGQGEGQRAWNLVTVEPA